MAHKLTNGNYRHNGITIKRQEIAVSTGWACEWRVAGEKFDTLKQAVEHINRRILRQEG
jgi:hypothetical protein